MSDGLSHSQAEAARRRFRLPDGSANPYLLQAGLLTAGLDGMRNRRDPGPRLDIDMYTDGHTVRDAKRLPLNLLDALRAFEGSGILRDGLGADVVTSYAKLRHAEWNDFARQLTDWERQTTLDC